MRKANVLAKNTDFLIVLNQWLRIIGLQVRALPGANHVPEPICRRFTPQKLTLAKRLLAKVLPLLKRPPEYVSDEPLSPK